MKVFELYVRTCPAMFFISSSRFLLQLQQLFVHSFMQFQLKRSRVLFFVSMPSVGFEKKTVT